MSLSQFVSKKFGKLEASSISGGAQTATILKGANITSATQVTISALQFLSGCIVRSGNGTVTDELPSAADLIAQINILTNTQASVGMSANCNFLHLGSSPLTINAGTDSTLGGATLFTNGSVTGASRQLIATLASVSGTSGSVYYTQTLNFA